MATNTAALQDEHSASLLSSGAGDTALGNLAALISRYGSRAPVADFQAHGPHSVTGAGPHFAYGTHQHYSEPIISPLRDSAPASIFGPHSFGQPAAPVSASTAPIHFAHNLLVKLTPDNYSFWRAQVVPLLRSHSLECFVDGSCPCPPPAHPSYRLWIAQDHAILSALQASLSEGVAGLLLFAATSQDVWVTLENNFSSQSSARSMAICAQLNEIKKRDLTITAFFNKVKGLVDTLASIGQPLRDDEFTFFIFNGLDKDYDFCFEAVNQRDDPMTPRDLYSRLLNTEQRIAY
jgi:hypothetical protein